jgi:hypothetical protein
LLCKVGFSCPIVANMSAHASNYDISTSAKTWNTIGPWGSGGATITVYGNSRCSGTIGREYEIGNPTPDGGSYCWCQMMNNGTLGAWVCREYMVEGDAVCASNCTYTCAQFAGWDSFFRPAVCVPPTDQNNSCDGTTVIADGACPVGYIPCIGSGAGSDAKGTYTISCSS